ncbi:zinc-dependent peptidase [Pseudomonas oryzihabitans]|nr:zinc-dependent peptidase [Pseudomonas psychrotolerans]
MGFWRAWRERRLLQRVAIADDLWARLRQRLPILDGLTVEEDAWLREQCVLFLASKRLTLLEGLELDDGDRLLLAAQALIPLLHLPEAALYPNVREIIVYPDTFVSPQRYRDEGGLEHEWDDERDGEAWDRGQVILAWPGVQASGGWEAYNLVIHEFAHLIDLLAGGLCNGQPPLHAGMPQAAWTNALQHAYDDLNRQLEANPDAETALDPYAAESPEEFFAVACEYFFSAPDLLSEHYLQVYWQLQQLFRQDPRTRLAASLASVQHPATPGSEARTSI